MDATVFINYRTLVFDFDSNHLPNVTYRHFFFLCSTLLVARAGSGDPLPAVGADCKRRVQHAYSLLVQAQQRQQGRVAVIRFLSETVYQVPGQKQPAKTVSRFVFMTKNNHTYISNGEMTVYQDAQTQVSVVRGQRMVLITQVPAGKAGELAPWAEFRSQLVAQSRITQCTVVDTKNGPQRRITAVPVAPSPMLGKVTVVEYWLDGRTDALQRLYMQYPMGSQVMKAGVVFEEQSWKNNDPAVDVAPLRQVLGANNKLLPPYQTYELQDQRNG